MKKLTIEEMKQIAKDRGGICLSKDYVDAHKKLKWQCIVGHIWEAASKHIKRGSWCPYCNGKQKLTIEEMKELAKSRGGKCLSENYINNRTTLNWQCNFGHKWEATPGNIKRGNWCPKCNGNQRPTIKEMKELAKSRGGKCLSKDYISPNVKLKWECSEGHKWNAIYGNIKRGSWCPDCAKFRRLKRIKK